VEFRGGEHRALFDLFRKAAPSARNCLEAKLPIPAYEQAIKASHVFNTLQARGVISVAERRRTLAAYATSPRRHARYGSAESA
jgi:glycyl-tRNA synthetase alpha chain